MCCLRLVIRILSVKYVGISGRILKDREVVFIGTVVRERDGLQCEKSNSILPKEERILNSNLCIRASRIAHDSISEFDAGHWRACFVIVDDPDL